MRDINLRNVTVDAPLAASMLPRRPEWANKGSFGRALLAVGSSEYRGAAYLAAEAALRAGCGYVEIWTEKSLADNMVSTLPEIIYHTRNSFDMLTDIDINRFLERSAKASAILVGCGCGRSKGLLKLVIALLSEGGSPLVLDADAINVISESDEAKALLRSAARPVVLTPHPLEMSRLARLPVSDIEADREGVALEFAREYGVTLLLKGKGSVITDGERSFINTTGSTALAKAGSGDALAGALVSLVSAGADPIYATVIAAYIHGAAGDRLSDVYSDYGVTPSDLPREMAKEIKRLCEM